MNKDFTNLIIFIGVCILIYIVFRSVNFQEGLENNKSGTSTSTTSTTSNGVAGGASSYAANVKTEVIKLQDELLVSKYRTDYENVVINMDDLVNNLMLKITLTIDQSKPQDGLSKLAALGQVKAALNSVMKFIDKT
jgi:hypothetical protein